MGSFRRPFLLGFCRVDNFPAVAHAWRSAVGSSFRPAVCLVAFYFALSMAFVSLGYIITVYGLRSLCGRSMVCGLS